MVRASWSASLLALLLACAGCACGVGGPLGSPCGPYGDECGGNPGFGPCRSCGTSCGGSCGGCDVSCGPGGCGPIRQRIANRMSGCNSCGGSGCSSCGGGGCPYGGRESGGHVDCCDGCGTHGGPFNCGWRMWDILGFWSCFGACDNPCSGCGEVYRGDYASDPPDCCEPCDCHGHWTGPTRQFTTPYDNQYYPGEMMHQGESYEGEYIPPRGPARAPQPAVPDAPEEAPAETGPLPESPMPEADEPAALRGRPTQKMSSVKSWKSRGR